MNAPNRRARFVLRLLGASALAAVAPPPAAAAEPCGGLSFARGTVATVKPLPLAEKFDAATAACVKAIGAGLKDRPSLRTVTIAVRLPDGRRIEGGGRKIADAYVEALVVEGVRRSRVSAVVPAAGPGEDGSVSMAFTEKRAEQPVALVEGAGGPVKAGPTLDKMEAAANGAMLPANTYVETGAGGRASLGLADGSRIRLAPGSLLLLGNLHLNQELRRVVQLELRKGDMEVAVAPGGAGSTFEVKTRAGVAGVRGTAFRVVYDEGVAKQEMRVDTFHGSVDLASREKPEATVRIESGQSAVSDASGKVSEPRELLAAATLVEPLQGAWKRSVPLRWEKVRGADRYLVRLARDAEFTFDVRDFRVKADTFELPKELPDAKWYWRIVPVDPDGFEGVPSKIYAFVPEA